MTVDGQSSTAFRWASTILAEVEGIGEEGKKEKVDVIRQE
ncbi:hypothetical protein SPHINGO8BC_50670 [Sphingobacterium multivorum]|uniref:Uncharacterized protein n=1 Tax=Sphingobacterium multivorum TaxID=28454 RepID=A0A654C5V6_SPHMU|nr:hypothetical protein SPHINGO8BC_50670 [Sphingobacterium multivorum]